MSRTYDINLDEVCKYRDFTPDQVVSSELVYPKGAVPNAQLIWIKIELEGGKRKFETLPLAEFHKYVKLPESSIGGWTDGEVGSDFHGLDPRYKIVGEQNDKEGDLRGDSDTAV